MQTEDLIRFLKDSGLHNFYPMQHSKQTQESSVVNSSGGVGHGGAVYLNYFVIETRETHPIKAFEKAREIRKYLQENLKGTFFNGKKILNVSTQSKEPLPIGEENGLYYVSYDYEILEGD